MKTKTFFILISAFFLQCTSTNIVSRSINSTRLVDVYGIFYASYMDDELHRAEPYFEETSEEIYKFNDYPFGFKEFSFFTNGKEFNPEHVSELASFEDCDLFLMIRETGYDKEVSSIPGSWNNGMYMGGGSSKEITHSLEAYIFTTSDTTEIWRAKIKVNSGTYGNSEQSGKSLGKTLIKKLKEDGILPKNFALSIN